ncbi:MAG: hypothetical protein ACRDFS_01125 [Chloroflexota bacterium]
MPQFKVPDEPLQPKTPTIRKLSIATSALTAAGVSAGLALRLAEYFHKEPVRPDQRDKFQTAKLSLSVLRTAPGLIKQVRTVIHLLRS